MLLAGRNAARSDFNASLVSMVTCNTGVCRMFKDTQKYGRRHAVYGSTVLH